MLSDIWFLQSHDECESSGLVLVTPISAPDPLDLRTGCEIIVCGKILQFHRFDENLRIHASLFCALDVLFRDVLSDIIVLAVS